MPLTFLAHQAVVLPVKHRWPDHVDGVGLAVGSAMPDLWYVTTGWLYGPFGIPLWVDGHQVSAFGTTVVVPGLLLALLVRRFVLGERGPRRWVTLRSVALGGATHLPLDALEDALFRGAIAGEMALSAVLAGLAIVMLRTWWPGALRRIRRPNRVGVAVGAAGAVGSLVWAGSRWDGWMPSLFTLVDGTALAMLVGWMVTPGRRRDEPAPGDPVRMVASRR